MKTKITSIFALALLITACSNDNDPINGGQGGDERSEIKLNMSVTTRSSVESNDNGVITAPTSLNVAFLRAPDLTSATATSDVWKAALAEVQAEKGTGSGVVDATLKNDDGANVLEFTEKQYYNIDGAKYSHLKGFYPKVGLKKNTHVSATWDIDGKTDVMVSDYFSNNKDVSSNPNSITFQHLLSKITIVIVADSPVSAESWGNVTRIEIEKTPSHITHEFGGDKDYQYDSSKSNTTKSIPIFKMEGTQVSENEAGTINLTTNKATYGQAMVYRQNSYELKVTTSGGTEPVIVDAPITGGAKDGKNHVITLTFKNGVITPTISVLAWEDGAEGSATID